MSQCCRLRISGGGWLSHRVFNGCAAKKQVVEACSKAAYLTLFISVSDIYLWYMLRAERRVGLILLLAGILMFLGIAFASVTEPLVRAKAENGVRLRAGLEHWNRTALLLRLGPDRLEPL